VDLESSTRQQLNNPDNTGLNEVELGDFESGVYQSNTHLYGSDSSVGDKQAIHMEAIKFSIKDEESITDSKDDVVFPEGED